MSSSWPTGATPTRSAATSSRPPRYARTWAAIRTRQYADVGFEPAQVPLEPDVIEAPSRRFDLAADREQRGALLLDERALGRVELEAHQPSSEVERVVGDVLGGGDAPRPAGVRDERPGGSQLLGHDVRQPGDGVDLRLRGLDGGEHPVVGPAGQGGHALGEISGGPAQAELAVVRVERPEEPAEDVEQTVVGAALEADQHVGATEPAGGGAAVVLLDPLDVRAPGLAAGRVRDAGQCLDHGRRVGLPRRRPVAGQRRVREDEQHHAAYGVAGRQAVDHLERRDRRGVDHGAAVDPEPGLVGRTGRIDPVGHEGHVGATVARHRRPDRQERRLERDREAGRRAGGERQAAYGLADRVAGEVVLRIALEVLELQQPGVDLLRQRLTQGVRHGDLGSVEQGRRDAEVHRSALGTDRLVVDGQPPERLLERRQEVLVAAQQRRRLTPERRTQQRLHPPLVGPEVAQAAEVRVVVDLGQREGGAVDATRRRPRDHVGACVHVEHPQQLTVDPVPPGQPVDLEGDSTDPDGEAHAAVQHDREAQLLARTLGPGHAPDAPPRGAPGPWPDRGSSLADIR